MWTSTRRGGGVSLVWMHVDNGRGLKPDFLVDIINGWPLMYTLYIALIE